jgi:hypothetical protein
MSEPDQPEKPSTEIIIEPHQLAGVWANFARVTHSEHEFTLDFVRMDYSEGTPPRRGIVVARVGFSPLFVLQLIEALNSNWAMYAQKAMPKEVRGNGTDGDEGPGASAGDAPAGS